MAGVRNQDSRHLTARLSVSGTSHSSTHTDEMTWGLMQPATSTYAPYQRGLVIERGSGGGGGGNGGSYSFPTQTWSGGSGGSQQWASDTASQGWKGGGTTPAPGDNNAALSALTLLSFLFFLNMLQQQLLSNSGQQTLLFMVGGTTGTGNGTFGRRRRHAGNDDGWLAEQDPILPEAGTLHGAVTFTRPLDGQFTEEEIGLDSGAGRLPSHPPMATLPPPLPPRTVGAEATRRLASSRNSKGDTEGDWREMSALLRGLVPASALPPGLAGSLSSCRAVVACTLHRATPRAETSVLADTLVTDILAGELQEAGGGLEAACEELLARARGECGQLASTFSTLLPTLRHDPPPALSDTRHLKHDPHDLL